MKRLRGHIVTARMVILFITFVSLSLFSAFTYHMDWMSAASGERILIITFMCAWAAEGKQKVFKNGRK